VEHTVGSTDKIERDELAQLIADSLNKVSKEGKIAYFLDEQEDPSMVVDWISTGSTLLDLAISNRPRGGQPVGRMVELNGLEGTGKSLIAAHLLASTQKKGGIAVMIDCETSAAPQFWTAVGVNLKNLIYAPLTTVEEIFKYIENIVGIVRKANKDRLLTIVVDSVAGASTEKELESEHGVDGYNTAKSIIISKAMRKITNLIGEQRVLIVFTNQLRMNMNAMAFGDKYVVPGGKALAYHCSVRVRLNSIAKIKKDDEIVGIHCKAQVVKNRLGPPHRTAEFDIFFDSGIQDLKSWLEFLKKQGVAKAAGATYKIKLNEEEYSLSAAEFVDKVNTDEKFKEEVYKYICDTYIMKYRDPNSKIDENTTESSEDDENSEVSSQEDE